MRSIGKAKINRLRKMVIEDIKGTIPEMRNFGDVHARVFDSVPSEWFDIWESAYTEIENIITEEISEVAHGVITI